jgi:regulator of protease activity HflC (stomatin/prohibitin superfamily)
MEILFSFAFLGAVVMVAFSSVKIVPQQQCFVVERFGRYHGTLNAGLHFVIPFIDVIRYRHSLKEFPLDIPEQICITKDNVQVGVDGILFFRVMDPEKASYGVSNYTIALMQIAQTTLRSEIGKIDLDKTFEEREHINGNVVTAIDKASDPWGVKVLRYEIKSIQPPKDVLASMEKQMKAEREKRAIILESEGERDARINRAEGVKQETIRLSEAQKQRQINEAEGQADAIRSVSAATGEGLERIARALGTAGGAEAARLKIAEEYVAQFGKMAKESNTMIVPANTGDVAGMLATAFSVIPKSKTEIKPA